MSNRVPVIGSERLAALLDYPSLTVRIGQAFTDPIRCPSRLAIERGEVDGAPSTMLVMAAARDGGAALVKVVTVGATLRSHVLLTDADGRPLAELDGEMLTQRRTAAASVRAAALLARPEAAVLAVLGAGPQAMAQARAFAECRPVDRVVVWARNPERAEAFAAALADETDLPIAIAASAADAVAQADIVTAATRSEQPLIRSTDVRAGTHIDLVGGFRPAMREADDALVARARIVADCPQSLTEAGDLAGPIAAGLLRARDVALLGDLLTAGAAPRRADDVTLYKSIGFATLDLVAAELALERLGDEP